MYGTAAENLNSALATVVLVGRQRLLADLEALALRPSAKPQIICITGVGGVGKTRLVQAFLERLQGQPSLRVAAKLIDLYHAPTHNSYGLVEEWVRVLEPAPQEFLDYRDSRDELERKGLAGDPNNVVSLRDQALAAFAEEVGRIMQNQRVVLALDTAERALYDIDDSTNGGTDSDAGDATRNLTTANVKPPRAVAQSWKWLQEQLPRWNNCVIVVAGRPAAARLVDALAASDAVDVHNVELGPFDLPDSLAYFDEFAARAEEQHDRRLAARVRALEPGMRLRAHELSGGLPILLALMLDYLSVAGGEALPVLLASHPAPDVGSGSRAAAQASIERELIGRLKTTPGIGDTIVALGRTPKGCDAQLLAEILGLSVDESEMQLAEVRKLSLVKVRPNDERIFLHDEMYSILDRQLFSAPQDVIAAARIGEVIIEYYRQRRRDNGAIINQLFEPLETKGVDRLSLPELTAAFDARRSILTEIVYYRLRQDATAGLKRYYRYMHEAVVFGDINTSVQLHTELLAYWYEAVKDHTLKDGTDAFIRALLALRPIELARSSNDYDSVLREIKSARQQSDALLNAAQPFAPATVAIWEASALSDRGRPGDLQQAIALLDKAIDDLAVVANDPRNDANLPTWLNSAALVFAYRSRAYTSWLQGFLRAAIEDYGQASRIVREINLRAEMAIINNDLGFTLAELGHCNDGRSLVADALELRRALGPRSPVGLSLNTLAIIDIMEGNYGRAIENSFKALSIFRAFEDERGIGLALTALSEAQRRQSGEDLLTPHDQRVALLREACERAEEAARIFARRSEHTRQVMALIELGCAYREWARIRKAKPSPVDPLERLVKQSSTTLEGAAKLAGAEMLPYKIDALVDLAWLWFHVGETNKMQQTIRQVEKVIPEEYRFDPSSGAPPVSEEVAIVQLWPQIGKLHMLKGHVAYAQEDLSTAAKEYFWGLEYSVLYAEEYHNLVRAKEEIYSRLKGRTAAELVVMSAGVQQMETTYQVDAGRRSALRQFMQRRGLWYGTK